MVHDTRDGQSKVYGETDDVIISVDEINMKYETWGIHNKEGDQRCDEVFQFYNGGHLTLVRDVNMASIH